MPIENDGIMIILSSPSGAGKTTLVSLLSGLDNFEISVSHTTRKPRAREIENKDYYFVEEVEFQRLIKNQEFLEYAKVFNNFYGTTRTPVINNLNKGKNVLFDIDWQGADQIKNKKLDYKLITFFILPPSKDVLFKRFWGSKIGVYLLENYEILGGYSYYMGKDYFKKGFDFDIIKNVIY